MPLADLQALLAHPLGRMVYGYAVELRKRGRCSVCHEPIGEEHSHIQIDRIGQHHLRCCDGRRTTCALTELARHAVQTRGGAAGGSEGR